MFICEGEEASFFTSSEFSRPSYHMAITEPLDHCTVPLQERISQFDNNSAITYSICLAMNAPTRPHADARFSSYVQEQRSTQYKIRPWVLLKARHPSIRPGVVREKSMSLEQNKRVDLARPTPRTYAHSAVGVGQIHALCRVEPRLVVSPPGCRYASFPGHWLTSLSRRLCPCASPCGLLLKKCRRRPGISKCNAMDPNFCMKFEPKGERTHVRRDAGPSNNCPRKRG